MQKRKLGKGATGKLGDRARRHGKDVFLRPPPDFLSDRQGQQKTRARAGCGVGLAGCVRSRDGVHSFAPDGQRTEAACAFPGFRRG
jgi:hypothetical protein